MPKIGLLSDSHGRVETTRHAVVLLVDHGVDRLIHLGDVGGPGVLDELVVPNGADDETIPAHVVFGNVDWDEADLTRYAEALGLIVNHPVGRLTFGDRELRFMHGHDGRAWDRALADKPAWLAHGHTHQKNDNRIGATRVINPGALTRAATYTVCVLDTDRDDVTFLTVSRD